MPTRWTQTLIPTARQVPAEAEVPSHQLMLRAGMIRKLGAGIYDYLPLGLRSLQKAMAIIREEMAAAGAVEVFLPTLIPIELLRQTGRDVAYGDNLFRIEDRHGREQALGPTHEEVITELVAGCVESYKQLPLTLYQIQTKFRDEFRPRFGVLRSREFQMKDAYSFHTSLESLDEIYQKQYNAYVRIFTRCGLPYRVVEAESGPIGGSASHEFMVPSPTGEDTILESDKGNYAANVEKCEIGPRAVSESFPLSVRQGHLSAPASESKGALEKVHTPNCASIENVGKFMKVKPKNLLKTIFFLARTNPENGKIVQENSPCLVAAVVRGDHEVNEGKALKAAQRLGPVQTLTLVDADRAREIGLPIGFVGPHWRLDLPNVLRLIDPCAAQDGFWATGANEVDHHAKYFNWTREVILPLGDAAGDRLLVADIRNAVEGDPSPKNDGGVLKTTKGIEIGHVFKLGDKYTKAMNVTILMPDNARLHPIMGCYGIGVNRILAAAIERQGENLRGYDDKGIIWPAAIAPYQVIITPIRYDGRVKEVAESLAAQIEACGGDVLIDDRDERPGVKFNDADLIGVPLRITIGDKTLASGQVEVKPRTADKAELVAIDQAAARTVELLKTL